MNHTRQRKNLMTSVGIEPTTSGLDPTVTLPTELQGRTEKVGDCFIDGESPGVNRGEEKVRVYMNVVPRSTRNKRAGRV